MSQNKQGVNNHKIVSLSVEERFFERIEDVRKKKGYQRSEFWRKAAHEFISQLNEENFPGKIQGVLTIIHEEKDEVITALKHKFTSIVETHLHTHLAGKHVCMDVLVLRGSGNMVEELIQTLQKTKGITRVKLAVA